MEQEIDCPMEYSLEIRNKRTSYWGNHRNQNDLILKHKSPKKNSNILLEYVEHTGWIVCGYFNIDVDIHFSFRAIHMYKQQKSICVVLWRIGSYSSSYNKIVLTVQNEAIIHFDCWWVMEVWDIAAMNAELFYTIQKSECLNRIQYAIDISKKISRVISHSEGDVDRFILQN